MPLFALPDYRPKRAIQQLFRGVVMGLCGSCLVTNAGCGTTKSSQATEQLLLSDAVDRSVAAIDFRILGGHTIFVDTRYIEPPKERPNLNLQQWNFVNAPYAIGCIRQQVMAAGGRLVDKAEEAEIIVEPRIGTLASDAHQAVIGIPASNKLSSAAELVPNSPNIPAIPELALARRETQNAAAKVAIFAYDRVTREPIWQSGLSLAQSTAKDTWIFGIGPYHRSAVREGQKLVESETSVDRVRHIVSEPKAEASTAEVKKENAPSATEMSPGIQPAFAPELKPVQPSPVVRASASELEDKPRRLPPVVPHQIALP